MQADRSIRVVADENYQLRCATCSSLMVTEKIAMLVRKQPDEPFDPLCASCAYEVIRAARTQFDLIDAMDAVLN